VLGTMADLWFADCDSSRIGPISTAMNLHVIACTVMIREIFLVAAVCESTLHLHFVEQELRNRPDKLRRMLQAEIDNRIDAGIEAERSGPGDYSEVGGDVARPLVRGRSVGRAGPGDDGLMLRVLEGRWDSSDVLIVPPGGAIEPSFNRSTIQTSD
jgi:hypothetical protein